MFSIAKIATIAAFAFGTFVSAIPVQPAERAVEARAQTITGILDSLNSQVGPLAQQFNSVHSGAAAAPIVSDISSAVQNAITQLNAPGLTIGQGDALTSLTNVLSTILTPAGQASSAPDVSSDFVPAFLPLGSVLGALVGLVLKLVGSLLIVVDVKASLLGLVGVLAPIIVHLNLTPLLVVLGILL